MADLEWIAGEAPDGTWVGKLTTPRTHEAIADWFEATGGYAAAYKPGEWKIRAQQKLWREGGLVGGAAGLQWAAVIDMIAPIVEEAIAQRVSPTVGG